MQPVLTVDIEKPAAGGRMLARHEGQVVLVRGAIPGERVRVRIERLGKGVLYGDTEEVLTPSADRRNAPVDTLCGGNVFAHIAYPRQCRLKGEIVGDALRRIGRVALSETPSVLPSPERGYRMRARLHAAGGRLGFFREGTHDLCDAASSGQLLPETTEWIAAVEHVLARGRLGGLSGVEIAENIPGDERACHLALYPDANPAPFAGLADAGPVTGLTASHGDQQAVVRLAGVPWVSDVLHLRDGDSTSALRLRRDVRAFFQGNRFLLEPLVRHVAARVPPGPVVDLYAGVGLFGLSLAAAGGAEITLVEGDAVSAVSLHDNAAPFADRVTVQRSSVESFLRRSRFMSSPDLTFIVDPPRTGVSREALSAIIRHRPSLIVYVSCDVATLARDARTLIDAQYELTEVTGIDLFPNTAHVETVTVFSRSAR